MFFNQVNEAEVQAKRMNRASSDRIGVVRRGTTGSIGRRIPALSYESRRTLNFLPENKLKSMVRPKILYRPSEANNYQNYLSHSPLVKARNPPVAPPSFIPRNFTPAAVKRNEVAAYSNVYASKQYGMSGKLKFYNKASSVKTIYLFADMETEKAQEVLLKLRKSGKLVTPVHVGRATPIGIQFTTLLESERSRGITGAMAVVLVENNSFNRDRLLELAKKSAVFSDIKVVSGRHSKLKTVVEPLSGLEDSWRGALFSRKGNSKLKVSPLRAACLFSTWMPLGIGYSINNSFVVEYVSLGVSSLRETDTSSLSMLSSGFDDSLSFFELIESERRSTGGSVYKRGDSMMLSSRSNACVSELGDLPKLSSLDWKPRPERSLSLTDVGFLEAPRAMHAHSDADLDVDIRLKRNISCETMFHENQGRKRLEYLKLRKPSSSNLDEIIGLDEQMKRLRHVLVPSKDVLENGCMSNSILLYGPTGCGKSFLCENIPLILPPASTHEVYSISPSDLHHNSGVQILREVFDDETDVEVKIVVLDHLDELCAEKSIKSFLKRKLEQLSRWKSNQEVKRIVMVGISSVPWDIDLTVFSRFEEKLIFGLPNKECRRRYLKRRIPQVVNDFDENDVNVDLRIKPLVSKTLMYSYWDLDLLVRTAFRRLKENRSEDNVKKAPGPSLKQLLASIKQVFSSSSSTISEEVVEIYAKFVNKCSSSSGQGKDWRETSGLASVCEDLVGRAGRSQFSLFS